MNHLCFTEHLHVNMEPVFCYNWMHRHDAILELWEGSQPEMGWPLRYQHWEMGRGLGDTNVASFLDRCLQEQHGRSSYLGAESYFLVASVHIAVSVSFYLKKTFNLCIYLAFMYLILYFTSYSCLLFLIIQPSPPRKHFQSLIFFEKLHYIGHCGHQQRLSLSIIPSPNNSIF